MENKIKNSTKFWLVILIIVSLLSLLRFPELFQGVLMVYIAYCIMDFITPTVGLYSLPRKYNVFYKIKWLIKKFNNYLDNL